MQATAPRKAVIALIKPKNGIYYKHVRTSNMWANWHGACLIKLITSNPANSETHGRREDHSMNSTTRTILGAGVIALGGLVAITPRYIFPVCEYFGVRMDMGMGKSVPMGCYYTDRASLLIGVLIAIIGIAVIIASRPATLRPLALILAGAGAATILVPTWLFPVCHNADMHCNQGAKPALIVLGILAMIIAVWLGISSGAAPERTMTGATETK